MAEKVNLSNDFLIPAVDYAGQGNAILGIRDAGKTYTAMKAAEELLDAGIPIIGYDPVGVWKNLKIGTGNNKGYQVVVAGGEGSDIRLTKSNAVDIVRAAMKENVSLIIDLYSPELINKSTWIQIVQETVDLLMYENKPCGLRHIFIEEAAEFIPQRLQPQHSKVYASLERLARMGRNARLGYTLINQRAEEVNKAILEISAFSLLHKQVGKNSLASIQKWLELLQVENTKEIIKSLPSLEPGECWAIGMGFLKRIKISSRKTFHPNPKKSVKEIQDASLKKVDVGEFVQKLSKQLEISEDYKKPNNALSDKKLLEENKQLRLQIKEKDSIIKGLEDNVNQYLEQLNQISAIVNRSSEKLNNKKVVLTEKQKTVFPEHKEIITPKQKQQLGKCPLAILQFLATFTDRSFTKAQVGIATGYSPNSGGFNNALSELATKGLIARADGRITVSGGSIIKAYTGDFEPQKYSIHTYSEKLGKCEREIYQVLLNHPKKSFTKPELADETESQYSYNSGGFNNALSTLHTLELIKRENGTIRLNPELLEI